MDRFIVGTGRCGSTLLSRMLAEHSDVASVFEYFNGMAFAQRLAPEPISGAEFAELISAEQPVLTAVLRRGYEVSEVTYPFDSGRYRRDTAVPWVLVSMLPRLFPEPDVIFDELMKWSIDQPARAAAEHHRALFAWVCEKLGRACWIERSGSSFDYLAQLAESFPEAQFLHIHRDGPETVLSMVHHHAYRLPISLLYKAPLEDGSPSPELEGIDFDTVPSGDDPISRVLASRPAPDVFGRYWSDQLLHGFRALRAVDADRYAEVRFEDLVADPHRELAKIARFFALPHDEGWRDRAAGLVRGVPRARADDLDPGDRAALDRACRPGQLLLGRA